MARRGHFRCVSSQSSHVDQIVPDVVAEAVTAVLVTLAQLALVDHLLAGHHPVPRPLVSLRGRQVGLGVVGGDTAAQQPGHQV